MQFSSEALLLFFILFTGGCLLLLIIVIFNRRRKKIIKINKLATGRVVDCIERTGLKGNRYYESIIRYQPFPDKEVLLRHFNSRKPRLLQKGKEVPLYYNPAQPEKYVLKDDTRAVISILFSERLVVYFL